jgi:hypothetical protein
MLEKALDAVRQGPVPTYPPQLSSSSWRLSFGELLMVAMALWASYWPAMLYSLVDTQCWSNKIRRCDATVYST